MIVSVNNRQEIGDPTGSASDLRYDAPIDLNNRNNSHSLLHRMVVEKLPPGSHVLEIGCATGRLGELIQNAGHWVSGVELNAAAAAQASQRLHAVFHGELDDFLQHQSVSNFNVVIMGDVLEHLPNPASSLNMLHNQMNPEASLVLSVPNVAHSAVRAALLCGKWQYGSLGILDATHLHFFTYDTILDLLNKCGWCAEAVSATYEDPSSVNQRYQLGANTASVALVKALTPGKTADVFQILIRARRYTPERQELHEVLRNQGLSQERSPPPYQRQVKVGA